MALRRLGLAVLVWLLAATPALAGPPTERLQRLFAETNRILADDATADRPIERLRAILTLVDDAFDWSGAAQAALGPEWHARSAAEQQQFVAVFADLVERAFVLALASRADASGGVRVRYLGESVDGPRAAVATALETRDGREVRLDYRMVEREGRWLVRDAVIDGVSVVANYRAQFHRVIRLASYAELVGQMRERLTDGPIMSRIAAHAPPRPAQRLPEPAPSAPEPATHGPPSLARAVPAPPPPSPLVSAPRVPGPVVSAPRAVPVPPTPAVAAVAAPEVPYWVQVGAFKNPAGARRLAARLGRAGVALVERRHAEAGGKLIHVRLGPFEDRRDAVTKLLELRSEGYRPFVVADGLRPSR